MLSQPALEEFRTSLRPLAVRQSLLLQLSGFYIEKSNLLKARMVLTPYNDHVGSFLRARWLALLHQLYSGTGADIVMKSITLTTQREAVLGRFRVVVGVNA